MDYRLDRQATIGQLSELEDLRWLFANLGLDPRYREWFRHRAWVRTIHGTTRIEGNSLNDLEVEEVLEQLPRTRSKDALEVLGTRSALAFVDEIAADPEVAVDERVIREIQKRVIDDIDPMLRPGEFRTGENRVADAEGNVIFTTALSGDVPDVMHRFGGWLRDGAGDQHVAVAAALAHLELVAIHPFYDGNGRTARALSRLLLAQHGFALDGLVSLDAYLDLQRRDYFAAIRSSLGTSYTRGYDATPFVGYYLGAIKGAAEHVLSRVKGTSELLRVLRAAVATAELAPQLTDPLVYAWINGSIRPSDYRKITKRTGPSATRDLAQAVRAGYLTASGETKSRRYSAGPKLQAVRSVPVSARDG
ncbi:MAG TPA: Fic family protein [Candidatus Limnocylindria bacterium]